MPDIDITAVTGYGEAVSAYNQAKLEAEGDPLKLAQADASWARAQAGLQAKAYSDRDAQRATDLARAEAATKYPDVDAELYNDVTDPAEIDRKAALLQAAIDKHKPTQPTGDAASWGGTPPSGATGAPATAPPKNREERLQELEHVIKRGIREPEANREFKDLTLESLIETLRPAAAGQKQ